MTPKQADSIMDYIEALLEKQAQESYDRYYNINQEEESPQDILNKEEARIIREDNRWVIFI